MNPGWLRRKFQHPLIDRRVPQGAISNIHGLLMTLSWLSMELGYVIGKHVVFTLAACGIIRRQGLRVRFFPNGSQRASLAAIYAQFVRQRSETGTGSLEHLYTSCSGVCLVDGKPIRLSLVLEVELK